MKRLNLHISCYPLFINFFVMSLFHSDLLIVWDIISM